jgi:uncharacterized protein
VVEGKSMPAKWIPWLVIPVALCNLTAASAATPSFDCANAKSSVETLICTDAELAKLDREVARLFTLARNGLRGDPRLPELIGTQRGWIRARDDCWRHPDARICVIESDAMRIQELREQYPEARSRDPEGISKGSMIVECADFDSFIGATFIQIDPPIVFLRWGDVNRLVLTLGPSASGARYIGKDDSGREVVFWDKGPEALLELPGRSQLMCQVKTLG